MSQSFPLSRKSALGYNIDEVEGFLARAREAYEAQAELNPAGSAETDSTSIRRASFGLQKGGYSPAHVDAALERLEDAFVARERARAKHEIGDEAWFTRSRERAREIVARLEREDGHKFARANVLTGGYNRDDVDAFCDTLIAYFRKGANVTVADVRGVVFRPKLGGYSEVQVDLVLDAVVDVMLSVR
ncbi:DivIVA domain-containing protein [Subtercola frigoramans]|uniref:DivIVA domain-containing protein n=1 Tax=Subtercola frigoramans TaxID=120298 RepID=A0ABS2L6V1_9MICO|nr:DivIVA domain-containing protein [Subtercola frigoramans]MBM7472826.1 DivIVA domain-containing protein [Subtercola frigoramans]